MSELMRFLMMAPEDYGELMKCLCTSMTYYQQQYDYALRAGMKEHTEFWRERVASCKRVETLVENARSEIIKT